MTSEPESGNDEMVDALVSRGYIETEIVEDAMRAVDRAAFVPESQRENAYRDSPLQIGEGQTISAPHMVAMMTEELQLEPGLEVLEVGTGCGYHAAVTAAAVGATHVTTVEYHDTLASKARKNLEAVGQGAVTVVVGDGSTGFQPDAPYDRVYLTCAAAETPEFLQQQLLDGGIAVLPIGKTSQALYVVERDGDALESREVAGVRFVPLLGEEG